MLKNFTIDFPLDLKKYISVFIGTNGAGKSTILEAIAQIFSSAILNKEAEFGFDLEYSVRLNQVLEETSTTSEHHTAIVLVRLHANKGEEIKVSISSGMDDTDYTNKVIESRREIVKIVREKTTHS